MTTPRPDPPFQTGRLRAQDQHWIHPWENFDTVDAIEPTIIARAEGIYAADADGISRSSAWLPIGSRWPRAVPQPMCRSQIDYLVAILRAGIEQVMEEIGEEDLDARIIF